MAMSLTDAQKDKVREWLVQGLKLADVQRRLETDFGLRVTYMEVRFLVDDLKVALKDPEPPKKVEPPAAATPTDAVPGAPLAPTDPTLVGVAVTVDRVTRPGALVSGRVTFSDGQGGTWFVDQMGRPGLSADKKGYKPSPADMQEFQIALEQELVKLGY
jgi:hypothetical protein